MMKSALKTLAISFGGGLALGVGMRLAQGPAKVRSAPHVDLDPLLARLQDVESRIVEMESTERVARAAPIPAPAIFSEKVLAAFESRLAGQLTDVEQLRAQIRQVDERLADLDVQLPALIQSTVDVRFREVEPRLQRDFEEAQSRSMAAFVETLQSQVVERISALETNLAEQSQVIGKLRDASVRSDENLQKMLTGIERLVDQSRVQQPAPVSSLPSASLDPAVEHTGAAPAIKEEAAKEHEAAYAGFTADEQLRSEPEERSARAPRPAAALHVVEQKAEEPAHIANAAQLQKTAPDVLVLGSVPAIPLSQDLDSTPHYGAQPEPVAQPVLAGTESQVPDSAASPQAPPLDEPKVKVDESYEWANGIGLKLLAPHARPRRNWRIPLSVGLVAGFVLIVGALYWGVFERYFDSSGAQAQTPALASTASALEAASSPVVDHLQALERRASAKPTETASLVELAREYQRRKDWNRAESAYRSALDGNPGNREAGLGLSDVLYQEQRYEESAAVLNKLSSEKPR